ncbi:prepilin-type N-terminal cleavage/methylation domain protein [Collimonas pratensis]|uniref:Prepilin-type N-terminal cleavage/methylation domain protein n=2 Tax=Collimonas pratensis TaxID=279113 RepID=A0ABM5ZBJ9_9BURK|nr:prepilin-type N-terminal cleavage/methylation domain protein [Collimonas pratensis]
MTYKDRQRALGFTLIELMVSVTIGLILILFLSSLYFNSNASSRLNDDNARIQEDGRYALSVIGRNLMQAGYGTMQSDTTTDFPPTAYSALQGLTGCNNGFATPLTVPPTCAAGSGASAFVASYTSEPYDAVNSPISGAGTDCSGTQAVNATSTTGGIVINSFYLDTTKGTLYCLGNANATPQALLSNVDNMLLTYGIDTGSQYAPLQSTQDATVAGDKTTPNGNTKLGFDRVISVNVCLEIHSTNSVVPAGQTYTNCAGNSVTAADLKLHTVMTKLFTVRNNATASLLN